MSVNVYVQGKKRKSRSKELVEVQSEKPLTHMFVFKLLFFINAAALRVKCLQRFNICTPQRGHDGYILSSLHLLHLIDVEQNLIKGKTSWYVLAFCG